MVTKSHSDAAVAGDSTTLRGASRLWDSSWAMFSIALLIRVAVSALIYRIQLDPARDHWEFGWETGRIANSIASGRGLASPLYGTQGPTAWMTPLYPYLLAGIFRIFGSFNTTSAVVILGCNSLFSAATCLPVFHIAKRLFGAATAKRAGWAWAFFPFAIYFAAARVWETCLTTFLFSLVIWLTFLLGEGGKLRHWALYGGLWGLTALTSPVTLSALPVLVAWVVHQRTKRETPLATWSGIAFASLIFLSLIGPWFVRNYRTFHQFIPFRDNLGLELRVGNNGDTSDVYIDWAHPAHNPAELQLFNSLGEISYFREKENQALDFIHKYPGMFLWLTARRFLFTWTGFWSLRHDYLVNEPFEIPNVLFSTSLTILMLVGMWKAWHEMTAGILPVVLCIVLVPLAYYVTHVDPNYRHPIDPVIVILAVYGAQAMSLSRRERAARQITALSLPSEPELRD